MRQSKQAGAAALEIVLMAVIVLIVGLVGYFVIDAQKSADRQFNQSASSQPAQQPSKSTDLPAASKIKSQDAIKAAEQELDSVNPDDSNADLGELDGQMAGF